MEQELIENGPTKAQMKRFEYEPTKVVEHGQIKRSTVYRRVPYYQTLVKRGLLDSDVHDVLSWYRDRYDAAQYSLLSDSLAKGLPRTETSGSYEMWRARILDAESDVKYAERGVFSHLLATLRAAVLNDMSASEIAKQRFFAESPNVRQVNKIMTEIRVAAFQMLAQVKHIVQ